MSKEVFYTPEEIRTFYEQIIPAYPIFIGDEFTPYNYGGLLNKINV